jgi:alcohol dehydrogenase/propanol-preferring alcohol dehydrogenase
MPTTMRAVVVGEPGAPLVLEERPIPEPGLGEVLVRVEACGICHSDQLAKEGWYPGVRHPLVLGHEVAGTVASLGEGVSGWTVGQPVGVGWFGGNCGRCDWCRRGDLMRCEKMGVTGVTFDGGYADYLVVPASALARLPADLDPVAAAPLMCAGVTTFNAIRKAGVVPGGRVTVLGLGGLGHLAVQYAVKLGFDTTVVARGGEKRDLAWRLGAGTYVDSTAGDPGAQLKAAGGSDLVLSTVTDAGAIAAVFGGLRPGGKVMVIGVSMEPIPLPPVAFVSGETGLQGHASGTAADSEDAVSFSARTGVDALVEAFPLERAAEAYERMISGAARFRVVLTTDVTGDR